LLKTTHINRHIFSAPLSLIVNQTCRNS